MSATSGIGIAPELSSAFSSFISSQSTRFLKISIRNDSLVADGTTPIDGSLNDDLAKLQSILEDNLPAYVLARLDGPSASLLLVDYVPDTAKVRDKMLYASTRSSLTKHLGSSAISDTLYATSKSDLTPEAYAAHLRHLAAPKPMSPREREMADIKAAERGSSGAFATAAAARSSPLGTGVGLRWAPEAESALKVLVDSAEDAVVTLTIDPSSETLTLLGDVEPTSADDLGRKLPASDPAYACFHWHTAPSGPQIIFIYTCPSSSPIKHRMLFSSGSSSTFQTARTTTSSSSPNARFASRKIETSDPAEVDGAFLAAELGAASAEPSRTGTPASASGSGSGKWPVVNPAPGFARPRGPARRAR